MIGTDAAPPGPSPPGRGQEFSRSLKCPFPSFTVAELDAPVLQLRLVICQSADL
jgi:hypothetical protein